ARRFKASWIELAEALARVLSSEQFRNWGYETFELYCRKELHIRRETAYKLTGSYTFLKSKAPHVLRRDGLRAPIPALESVEYWKRAEAEEVPEKTLDELRAAVVDEGAPVSALKRRYQEVVFPVADEDKQESDRKMVLMAAQRLANLLADTKV